MKKRQFSNEVIRYHEYLFSRNSDTIRLSTQFFATKGYGRDGHAAVLRNMEQVKKRDGRTFTPSFTKTNIENHLNSNMTYYYSNELVVNKLGGVVYDVDGYINTLVCIDIDVHNDEQDADSVLKDVISLLHGHCYHEKSTSSKGYHVYFIGFDNTCKGNVVDTSKHLNALYDRLIKAIAKLISFKGYDCRIDPKFFGNYCLFYVERYGKDNRQIKKIPYKQALMMKMPRLKDNADDFYELQGLSGEHLLNNIMSQIRAIDGSAEPDDTAKIGSSDTIGTTTIAAAEAANNKSHEAEQRNPSQTTKNYSEFYNHVSPFKRKAHCVIEFYEIYKRFPGIDEALTFYVERYKHTDNDGRDRHRPMQNAINLIESSFKPELRKGKGKGIRNGYDYGMYNKLINELHEKSLNGDPIDNDPYKELGCKVIIATKREKVNISEIDVMLGLITIDVNKDAQTPRASMLSFASDLVKQGIHDKNLTTNKCKLIKEWLIEHGLIYIESDSSKPMFKKNIIGEWKLDSKGKARTYGIGMNHPQFNQDSIALNDNETISKETGEVTSSSDISEDDDIAARLNNALKMLNDGIDDES